LIKQIEKIKKPQSNQAGQNNQKALGLVNRILSGNLAGISGTFRSGNIPGLNIITGSGQTQADFEGLKNLLALASRGQLKGSGAVSDFEARMLEKAAMAGLDPTKMSTPEFKRRLEELRADLSGGQSVGQIVTAPDGQQIEIID